MKSLVTVIFPDNKVMCDNVWYEFEDFKVPEGHEIFHALHWENGKGEIEYTNYNLFPNKAIEGEADYNEFVKPYTDQWDTAEAAYQAEKKKQEEHEASPVGQAEKRIREIHYELSDINFQSFPLVRSILADMTEEDNGTPDPKEVDLLQHLEERAEVLIAEEKELENVVNKSE